MTEYVMKRLCDEGKYQEAIDYASDPAVRNQFNEWDYFYLSKCLYSQKNYEENLNVYKELIKKYPNLDSLNNSKDALNNRMGWSIYYVYLKNFDYERGNRNLYYKRVDYVLRKCSDSEYSPKKFIAQRAVDDIFKQKMAVNINYELADRYLSAIDPLQLDTTEKELEVDGRRIRAASEREQWYVRKIKALIELNEYEQCLKYADDAFENIDRFHNDANHWINYRRAKSLFALGDLEQAEKTIKSIQQQKFTHWCLYGLLFEIASSKGQKDEAMRYGALCSTADRTHSPRVSFYEKYAGFLLENGYQEEASLIYRLVELIRIEKEWKVKSFPKGYSHPDEVASLDKKEVLKKISPFWNKERERGLDFREGTISKILKNGKTGFIVDSEGNSYYFDIRDFTKRINALEPGLRVRYTLEDRLDASKGIIKPNAVQISLLK